MSGGVALAGVAARRIYLDAQETRRRRSSPLQFNDALTPVDFIEIVQEAARRTPRVRDSVVTGMTIVLHVKSNTGLSIWNAEVDFNDYGHLTGTYWLNTENSKSAVPKHFADLVQAEIKQRIR
ncbi:hypothetical protein M1E17_09275 [Arthrobacter sp. D1-29]